MKLKIIFSRIGGFNALDLLIMLLAVVIVGLVGFAFLSRAKAKPSRINCVALQKQIGLAFRLWSGDNNDKLPMQVSTNNGGTLEFVGAGVAYPHFAVMSNELATPKVLVCFSEPIRPVATNFIALRDVNISYFVGVDALDGSEDLWLSGDKNLAVNGAALRRGLATISTNSVMSWTSRMHSNQGNICLADGSVQQWTSSRLQQSATNAFRAYYAATTNASFRLAIP